MVLGLNRARLRSDVSGLFAIRTSPIKLDQAGDWVSERGAVLFETEADLFGGFPGYAEHACRMDGARLTITPNFLLISEGQLDGFGLPLRWLEGTALVQFPGKTDAALRIFYRESGSPRSFTIRFGATRLGSRGVTRATRVRHALQSTGMVDRFAEEPPIEPNFTLEWDQTREFENENAIWTGRASAPIEVGAENIPSDVWLTTKSLIWGGGAGSGLNRIPLSLLMNMVSARVNDRVGTPAVYLSIGDARTGRFEIPFVFDLHTPPDRNFRERGAFVVGLRSRGLPDGKSSLPWQPWRTDPAPRALSEDDKANLAGDLGANVGENQNSPATVPAKSDDRGSAHAALRWNKQSARSVDPADDPSDIERIPAAGVTEHEAQSDSTLLIAAPSVEESVEADPDSVDVDESATTENQNTPPSETDPGLTDPWFADIETPIVPLIEVPTDSGLDLTEEIDLEGSFKNGSHTSIVDMTLSELELEEEPTERFAPEMPDSNHAPAPSEDFVLAEWSASEPAVVETDPSDMRLAESWSEVEIPEASDSEEADRLVETAMDSGTMPKPDVQIAPSKARSDELWTVSRKYEATAIGALAEALRLIDDRIANNSESLLSEAAPSSWEQAQAVAEIGGLVARGIVSGDEARSRRERLLSLGDVSVRLRTLVELFDGGYLTTVELDAKRSMLVKQLSHALMP